MKKDRLAILIVVAAIMAGCSSGRPIPVTVSAASPALAPATPAAAAAPEFYQTTGPLVVENQVDVGAERQGVVTNILADVGARVRKGQLLAQLDDRQLTAQHDAAVAKALAAEQDSLNWDTEIKLVETDLSRDEQLYQYKLITLQQLEHSRYKLVGARQQKEREVENTREARELAKALELELDKTRIIAPFDGVVARRYIRVGQNVATNDRLFWVTATAPLNVRFTLPQELVAKVKAGELVAISAPGGTAEHQAKITLVSPVVDPASGTIEVQARVEGEPADLRPGMTVTVKVNRL
ncbi:MAG: efflux RND transporter periplasmic adaptor subunit [Terriglobales bacterium]